MTNRDQRVNPPRFRRAAHVAWRKIGAETVVLDLKEKRAYGLNEPGGILWQALAERSEGDHPADAFMPSEPQAAAFLGELASLGLVEALPNGTSVSATPLPAGFQGSPEVTWSDEIRAFGGSICAKIPGQSTSCDTFPKT